MTYLDPPVNPYDPAVQDFEPQTLPLDEIIRRAIRAQTALLRVCLPAQVTKVLENQKVNVQPGLQIRYIDQNQGQNLPQVQNVPVSMPVGQNYSIKVPVAVGDTGYLIFSDRNLDAWLAGSGDSVDPQDSRQHDLSDAIFVPGLVPYSNQTTDDTTDIVITNGKAKARIQAAGTYTFANQTNELMDVMDKILANIDNLYTILTTETYTLTILGPQPFIASTQTLLTNAQTAFEALKTKWETLKGTQ